MAPQSAVRAGDSQAPDLADLKRRAEQLMTDFAAATEGCRRCASCARCGDGCEYLDTRRDLVVATQLRQAAELIARAAHSEEVREAVTGRAPQRHVSRRVIRALHVIAAAGGAAGAAAVGAGVLTGGIF